MERNQYKITDLYELIKEVMGISTITPMIHKQIQKFVLEYKMTPKEIARCIVWYVEVAQQTLDVMYGIGIIPNIREKADQYFAKLELEQQKQKEEAKKVVEYQDNNIIFNIKNMKHEKKKARKQWDISQINTKGDDE